jgi:bacterioferritin-associated ferredoxin
MYVCLCNGYRERDIREAVVRGARTVDEIYSQLGQAPCCGACVPYAEALIDETAGVIVGHTAPHLRSVAE